MTFSWNLYTHWWLAAILHSTSNKATDKNNKYIGNKTKEATNKKIRRRGEGGRGYSPLCFGRYLMMMVKGVFQSNGILKEFSFQTRQEDLTTAFRCRTLDWGLSTLRSDPVKAVTPDQLPVVRHHCPAGTHSLNLFGFFLVSLSPFLSISLERPRSSKYRGPERHSFHTTDFLSFIDAPFLFIISFWISFFSFFFFLLLLFFSVFLSMVGWLV